MGGKELSLIEAIRNGETANAMKILNKNISAKNKTSDSSQTSKLFLFFEVFWGVFFCLLCVYVRFSDGFYRFNRIRVEID